MASTSNHDLDTGWVELADGAANVTVQLRSNGPVLIYVGTGEPDAGSMVGVLLVQGGDLSFAATGLAETDKVFARATADPEFVTVVKS